MRKLKLLLAGCLTLTLLTACGGQSAPVDLPTSVDPAAGIVAGSMVPTLNAKIENGVVEVTFIVENQTEIEQQLTFNSGKKFDFIIYNKAGEKVYQSSDEKMYVQVVETVVLKQGEKLTFNEKLDASTANGAYAVEAWLTADQEEVRAEGTFEIK
jgi:hypothetical protein